MKRKIATLGAIVGLGASLLFCVKGKYEYEKKYIENKKSLEYSLKQELYVDPLIFDSLGEQKISAQAQFFKKSYYDIINKYKDIVPKTILRTNLKEEFVDHLTALIFAETGGDINAISKSKVAREEEKRGRGIGQFTYQCWINVMKEIGKEKIEELGFNYEDVLSYEGWLKYTLPKNGKDEKERYNILKLNLMAIICNAKLNEEYLVKNSDIEEYPTKLLEAIVLSHNSGAYVQLRSWKKHKNIFKGYRKVSNVRGGELKSFTRNIEYYKKLI